jgi:hypothetical protein
VTVTPLIAIHRPAENARNVSKMQNSASLASALKEAFAERPRGYLRSDIAT